MRRFLLIMVHYLKRMFADTKEIVLLVMIPLGITLFMGFIAGEAEGFYFNGYNIFLSFVAPAMVLSFQFFNAFFIFLLLYADFRDARRWRLLASPCTVRGFVIPAFVANWLLSLALGVVSIVIMTLFMNIYWGSWWVLAVVLMITSLMASFVGMLIFLFTKRIGQANGIGYVVSFGLMVISGFMIPLQLFGDNVVVRFLTTHGTPLTLGTSAIVSSGELTNIFEGIDTAGIALPGFTQGGDIQQSIRNILILLAITAVLGVLAILVARRKKV